MGKTIQNWAFIAPKMSRDLSQYFEGILDFIKDDPSVFLHAFTFTDPNLSALAAIDGVISYTIPPQEVMEALTASGRPQPPIVAFTMCRPTIPTIAYAHIDPDGIAERVFGLLSQRHCRSYAFCSSHEPFSIHESAALLKAYRKLVFAETGHMPRLFRPISTLDINLIATEVERFTRWFAQMPRPCGMFVHGDNVARKMLDTCRLRGIRVPDELRVIGTGNSPIFCERTYPTLSSYSIDHEHEAAEAARVLKQLINGELTPEQASYEISLPDVTERASSIDERGSARIALGARAFIHDRLRHGETPSARDIAFHLNSSLRKIEADFRSIYGHTLREEIADARIERLCSALRSSNEPIKVLVARAGFGDMSIATRTFRERFGMTMSEYRRGNQAP